MVIPLSLLPRLLQKDTERNPNPTVSNSTPEPPKIYYNSAFDIPLEKWEGDSVYIHRTQITEIEKVDQDDLEKSIIGGMEMAAILKFEPRGPAGIREIGNVYLSEIGTHVFRRISDQEKQLATIADLKVGQEIEVQYCYPITPVFLAIEILILNETDR